MPRKTKRAEDFLALVPKCRWEVVGFSQETFRRREQLALRVWEVGKDGDYYLTGHGANMPSRLWAEALPHIEAAVECKGAYAAAIPKGGGQELRVSRGRYCESDVVSVRVFRETLDNGPLPSRNGLTARPEVWRAILPYLLSLLEDQAADAAAA